MKNHMVDIRLDYDLPQREVANIIGISRASYGRWETNERIIPLKQLKIFSDYFKFSIDYIFGFNKENNYKKYDFNQNLIGQRIKLVRKNNNLTQEDLAKKLNTTHSTISAYENGKYLILTDFAYQIAKEFNISMDWILGK